MRIEIVDTADLGETAARLVRAGIDSGDVRVWGVATGSSPLPVYRALDARPPARVREVEVFALDEYVGLPPGHPESYRAFVEREIAAPLGIPLPRVHVLDGSAPDLEEECRDYEAAMRAAGGVDLQILGIGSNGHIGFNEPGSSRDSRTRVAALSERTRADNARFFPSPRDVPTHCLTQGLATILAARRIVLVASGAGKAQAVARAVQGPVGPELPASFLQDHPDTTLVIDRDAASMLTTQGASR